MRDVIKGMLLSVEDKDLKYKMLREYLQALVLKLVEQKGYSKNIAFVGGTALRFLHDIGRFSEDLDFSLIFPEGFDFNSFLAEVQKYFQELSIPVEFKPKTVRAVNSAFLRFQDVMYENGLSHRRDQKLFIKLELDSNPPAGFVTDVSFVQRLLPMNIAHYNISSLFAGKLHAVLLRQYTKGRDFYDLMWFLGKKTIPNYLQLQNAIFQTTKQKMELNGEKVKELLKKRLLDVDWKKAADEVREFLLNREESQYLVHETFRQLVDRAVL